jgi:hypothetical protein
MAMKWFSPKEFANLLADFYSVSAGQVRSWCENGLIPAPYARRNPSTQERGHWRICMDGLESTLQELLELSDTEMHDLRKKLML